MASPSSVASGTRIDAQATIVFDTNESIDTPPIFNTLDGGAPQSMVSPLAAESADPSFLVSWSGEDDAGGSGIAHPSGCREPFDGDTGAALEAERALDHAVHEERARISADVHDHVLRVHGQGQRRGWRVFDGELACEVTILDRAVDAITNRHLFFAGLDVNVRCALLHGLEHQRVDPADDRGLVVDVEQVDQLGTVAGHEPVEHEHQRLHRERDAQRAGGGRRPISRWPDRNSDPPDGRRRQNDPPGCQ